MGTAVAEVSEATRSGLDARTSEVFGAAHVMRAKTLVAPRVAEENSLEDVICQLREIDRHSGLQRTLSIGQLILDRFFGGDPKVWRDRRRNKNNSIRRLAARPDCPLGRSALSEAVGIYVAVRDITCVRSFGHISASHVAATLRLPRHDQEELLRVADAKQWSVRALKEAVTARKRRLGERRGRPKTAPELRALVVTRGILRRLQVAIGELQAEPVKPAACAELQVLANELDRLALTVRSIV